MAIAGDYRRPNSGGSFLGREQRDGERQLQDNGLMTGYITATFQDKAANLVKEE